MSQSAPTDGRDQFVNSKGQNAFYTSKQNSDAKGMFYQCGRKDPFTFATSSEKGSVEANDYGKYPVKIYTIDGVLIYQENRGRDNKDKQPAGGIISSSTVAISMMETTKNPIIFYQGAVVSQIGHTKALWDYYWTSYSRGTDGKDGYGSKWHNAYLDEYISQRSKSIYDPCPFGFIAPSNGTYLDFTKNSNWILNSYAGGTRWNIKNQAISWLQSLGWRSGSYGVFEFAGSVGFYRSSTVGAQSTGYTLAFDCGSWSTSYQNGYGNSYAQSVRCIEELKAN